MNVSLSSFDEGVRVTLKLESDYPNLQFVTFSLMGIDGLLCHYEEKEVCRDELEVGVYIEQVSSGEYIAFVETYLDNGDYLKVNSKSLVVNNSKLSKADELLKFLIDNPQVNDFKKLIINYPSALKYSFLKIRGLFHSGSSSANIKKLVKLSANLLPSDKNSIILFNLPSQQLFLSTLLVYGGDCYDISINREKINWILSFNKFSKSDYYFISGLSSYKLGDYSDAANNFNKIMIYKDDYLLPSHQLSAINYRYPFFSNCENECKVRDFFVIRTPFFEGDGVVLISCDWGFFSAYHHLTQLKADKYGVKIHYHLILPVGFDIDGLKSEYIGGFGLSYELEPVETRANNKNYKTYYSLSRYLIAEEVSKIYNKKILISDMDIDYNSPVSEVFSAIQDDEAALVFSTTGLPWARIMAGFNVFGRCFFKSDFYKILCNFMILNYKKGLDFWMLDQVSLEVAYQNSSRETISKIKSMNDLKSFKISQQAENSKIKQKARLNIIKAISDIDSGQSPITINENINKK